jgi:hypothetical protein
MWIEALKFTCSACSERTTTTGLIFEKLFERRRWTTIRNKAAVRCHLMNAAKRWPSIDVPPERRNRIVVTRLSERD